MSVFDAIRHAPDNATTRQNVRFGDFEVVRTQGTLCPYDVVTILPTPFLDGGVFSTADNTSFHSFVVAKIATDARAVGAVVATEVQLRPVQGGAGPRVDLILRLPGQPLTFMDVKTGDRPRNTSYQEAWYPTIPLGWHLTTDDVRIEQFGLAPGQPFPPSLFEYWTQRDVNSDAEIYQWKPRR